MVGDVWKRQVEAVVVAERIAPRSAPGSRLSRSDGEKAAETSI